MRSLYARLHTRFGEPIDRREMLRRSLAAAAGVLLERSAHVRRPAAIRPARRRHRRRLRRPRRRLRAVAGRLGRHGPGSAQPRRRPRPQLPRPRAGRDDGRRRGTDWIQSSDLDRLQGALELSFLNITDEDGDAPIVLNGRRLDGRGSRSSSGTEMSAALSGLNAGCRRGSRIPLPPGPRPIAAAWDTALAGGLDCRAAGFRSVQGGHRRADGRRQRRRDRLAELSRQPVDGERGRRREVLDARPKSTAAPAAASSSPSKLAAAVGIATRPLAPDGVGDHCRRSRCRGHRGRDEARV